MFFNTFSFWDIFFLGGEKLSLYSDKLLKREVMPILNGKWIFVV